MSNLKVQIADTPDSLSKGLMFVKEMDHDKGMLFKFPSVIEASFWGKNTYLPLDIAFVDKSNKITDIRHIAPLSTKLVRSNGCIMAIEANAGFFKKNGIQPGHSIEFVSNNEISFKE
jgi:uncharacterized protein